jgi:archaellum biogenesis ATPase FlaH
MSNYTPLPLGIPSRGITPETCLKYRTYAGRKPLEVVHEYFTLDTDYPCGTKFRVGGWTVGKKDVSWEAGSERSLFGCHLYTGTPTPVYLFEGETDAMAASQVLDGLCIAYGGTPTPSLLSKWASWIEKVSTKLYLCFDNDSSGVEYTGKFLDEWRGASLNRLVLPPGIKDIAELLMSGGEPTFEELHYTLPDFILTGEDLATVNHVVGEYQTTGHPGLDTFIGGYSPGKIIVLAGPTKSGKSSFTADLAVKYLQNHEGKILYIPLELNVDETMSFIASASLGVHISEADPSIIAKERARLSSRILMARHFGHLSIDKLETILQCIPYTDVKLLVLDHITMAATSFTEGLTTNLLDAMMSRIQAGINQHGISAIVVTHTNATGSGNEILSPSALRGSQSMGQLASSILGIRRLDNGQSEVYTIAPDRFTGKMGRLSLTFDGSFRAFARRTSNL